MDKKYVVSHLMECYSVIEGNEILIPTTTWIKLEDIMLNEVSWTQKDKYYIIPLIRVVENNQTHGDES